MRFFLSSRLPIVAVALCLGAFAASSAVFEPLFVAGKVVGQVRVVRPDGSSDVLKEAHAYPYGTRIEVPESLSSSERRTATKAGVEAPNPQAMLVLSPDYRFRLGPGTRVVVSDLPSEGDDAPARKVLVLEEGVVFALVTAPSSGSDSSAKGKDAGSQPVSDLVVVRTPLCDAFALAEQNQIRVSREDGDSGFLCRFVSPAGKMQLSGRQFTVPRIKRNTEIEVSGSEDYTRISAPRGDFTVVFEKGADAVETVPFKTRTIGKIIRQYAAVGHRMAVSVMVSFPPAKPDAERVLLSYSYLEGQTGVGVEGRSQALGGAVGGDETQSASQDSFGALSSDGSDGFDSFGDDSSSSSSDSTNDTSAFAGFDEW